MIAAASPRLSERFTPERIARGPRGVAYCLVMFAASSMNACADHAGINVERTGGHSRNAVVLAHALGTAPAQFLDQRAVPPERQDSIRQGQCAAGLNQDAAAGRTYDFRERPVAWLHHRD